MLLASCISPKVEYIDRPVVPEVAFPVFPDIGEVSRNPDGTVTVPGEWIVRLAEYKIRIEETEKNYKALKNLYEGNNGK